MVNETAYHLDPSDFEDVLKLKRPCCSAAKRW